MLPFGQTSLMFLLECVDDVLAWMGCVNVGNWRFTSKCSCLKSALDALDALDKSSHNFFIRHTAIRHIIYEKYSWKPWCILGTWWWVRRVDDGVNVGSWRFTSKCSCLKSALVHQTAPDVLSHNFFIRHTAIRHIIYEKYSWKSLMYIRYIVVLLMKVL